MNRMSFGWPKFTSRLATTAARRRYSPAAISSSAIHNAATLLPTPPSSWARRMRPYKSWATKIPLTSSRRPAARARNCAMSMSTHAPAPGTTRQILAATAFPRAKSVTASTSITLGQRPPCAISAASVSPSRTRLTGPRSATRLLYRSMCSASRLLMPS